MNKENISGLLAYLKKNRRQGIILAVVLLLSTALIIAAVNMLHFPNGGQSSVGKDHRTANSQSGKGGENKQNAGGAAGRNNPFSGGDNAYNGGSDPFKREDQPQDRNDLSPKERKKIQGKIEGELKSEIPDIRIDLDAPESTNGIPSIGGGDSYSVYAGGERKHDPIFEIYGKLSSPYLKTMSMEHYSNNGWSMNEDTRSSLYPLERPQGDQSIVVQLIHPVKGFLPLISNLSSAFFPGAHVSGFESLGAAYSDSMVSRYEMFYDAPLPSRSALRKYEVDSTETYSFEGMDKEFELAKKIAGKAVNASDKIDALEKYLKERYILDPTQRHSNNENSLYGDDIDQFLFETYRGNQLDFLSAFVTLLRCMNVPAHMATGYRLNPEKKYQVVYQDQMAVFPEVKFEGIGWVPIQVFDDFTPYIPDTWTVTSITQMDSMMKKGQTFHIRGTVTDDKGRPLEGLQVLVYLKKKKDDDCLSVIKDEVKNGIFEMSSTFTEDTDVGNYQVVAHTLANNAYRESWSDPELKIMADSAMELSISKSVWNGRKFSVKGSVWEGISKQPVKSGEIKIEMDDARLTAIQNTVVDAEGNISGKYSLDADQSQKPELNLFFIKKYATHYTAYYVGNDLYLPCQQTGTIQVWVVLWGRLFAVLALLVLLGAALMLLLWRRRRAKRGKKKTSRMGEEKDGKDADRKRDAQVKESSPPEHMLQREDIELLPALSISFPDIRDGLPGVWGLGEPLKIRFLDEIGNWDEAVETFLRKGGYRISVTPAESKGLTVEITMRIVVYREEIIRLGNELFDRLYGKNTWDRTKQTPREMLEEMRSEMEAGTFRLYERIIGLFEWAVYSQKEMDRKSYVDFYQLIKQIETEGDTE